MTCHTLGPDQELALEGGRWGACWQMLPIPHQALLPIFQRHPASIRAWLKGFVLRARNGSDQESALEEVGGLSWGAFKPVLADAVIAHLAPLQQRYADVMADPGYLDQVRRGAPHLHEFGWVASGMQRVY